MDDDASPDALAPSESSPLARARIRGRLTVEQAAATAGIGADEAHWLEEGRLYRFADADAAIAATIAYAGAIGALAEQARTSAARDESRVRRPRRRRLVLAAAATAAIGIAAAVVTAVERPDTSGRPAAAQAGAAAATPATAGPATAAAAAVRDIVVDAIDAAGRPGVARSLATRLRELGYRVGRVTGAGRSDEPDTAVYYEPGGAAAGARLARTLGLPSRPLPAGSNPRRLVVLIGKRGLGAG